MIDCKQGIPRHPSYKRLLLIRGSLDVEPGIYVVKWFPVVSADDPESIWTWVSEGRGLSILTLELNREILRKKWLDLVGRVQVNIEYFDSLRFDRPVRSKELSTEGQGFAVNST
jgi:hypothetical protein